MSFSQSMSISRESMMNNQLALTVVSHNIANINSEGYSKRRVEFQECITPYSTSSVVTTIYGLRGSQIGAITSYVDQTLNTSAREANATNEYFTQLDTMLGNLEAILDDLGDQGIQAFIDEFFTAAQNLSKYPTDSTVRAAYVKAAENVASKLNSVYSSAETLKSELAGNGETTINSQIAATLEEANVRLEKIAEINKQILLTGQSVGSTNSLIDQREMLIDELSSIIPVSVAGNANGTINLMLGNTTLVSGAVYQKKLQAAAVLDPDCPVKVQAVDVETNEVRASDLNNVFGERSAVGAILTMVTSSDDFISLNTIMEQLDILANDFAAAVNEIQTYSNGDIKACYLTRDANGNTILGYDPAPPDIFTGTGAKDIRVTDEILANSNLIAVARANTDPTTNPNWELNVGNNENILETAQLRNKNIIDSTGLGNPSDSTVEDFLSSLTLRIGVQGNDIQTKRETQESVLATILTERQGAMGVNMDEELADMIKYQRAYEASARIFTTVNEAMETLINLGR